MQLWDEMQLCVNNTADWAMNTICLVGQSGADSLRPGAVSISSVVHDSTPPAGDPRSGRQPYAS